MIIKIKEQVLKTKILLLFIVTGLLIGQSSNISARLIISEKSQTPEERLQEKGYNTDKESLINLVLSLSPEDAKDVSIENYVFEALGNLHPDEEVASVLLEILQRPIYSHAVYSKCKIAIALSHHNKEKAIPYLKKVMQKDKGYAGLEAAGALADIGDSSGYELVIELYKKEGASPSSTYILLISKFAKFKDEREDVISILKEYLDHRNPIIGLEAAGALADIGDISGRKLVVEVLKQSEYLIPPVDQEYAMRVLPKFVKFKDVDVLDLCFEVLQRAIRLGRGYRGGILFEESISAIEKIGDKQAIPRLENILNNLRKKEKESHPFIQGLKQALQELKEEKGTSSISEEELSIEEPKDESKADKQLKIYLKNGNVVKGRIVREDKDTMDVRRDFVDNYVTTLVNKEDIERIEELE